MSDVLSPEERKFVYGKENYGNQIKTVKIWIELSKHGNEQEPTVLWKKNKTEDWSLKSGASKV